MVEIKPGMTVRVHQKIRETNPKGEEKERVQVFEGIVLALKGKGASRTMTVRKIGAGGIGVEKIFPLNLPSIDKIEPVKQKRVRQARPYYLRTYKKRIPETPIEAKEATDTSADAAKPEAEENIEATAKA